MTLDMQRTPDTPASAPQAQAAEAGGGPETRLDILTNNSDDALGNRVRSLRGKAAFNNAWAESRVLVSKDGEILCNEEGEPLTLKDLSRSWYSKQGARNNARAIARRLMRASDHPADLHRCTPKFITLTYRGITESWEAERDIQKFTDCARKYAKRHGGQALAYFWTGETQQRGALHYHIVILGMPFLLKSVIRSWWPHGFVKIAKAGDVAGSLRYLAKYIWKFGKLADDPANLPDWWFYFSIYSKRRYGFSQWFRLPALDRVPRWLRDFLEEQGASDCLLKAGRAPGGGWSLLLRRSVGEVELWVPSLWTVWERGTAA